MSDSFFFSSSFKNVQLNCWQVESDRKRIGWWWDFFQKYQTENVARRKSLPRKIFQSINFSIWIHYSFFRIRQEIVFLPTWFIDLQSIKLRWWLRTKSLSATFVIQWKSEETNIAIVQIMVSRGRRKMHRWEDTKETQRGRERKESCAKWGRGNNLFPHHFQFPLI